LSRAALAQSPAGTPEFEAAEVKVNHSIGPDAGEFQFLPGGRIEVSGVTVRSIVMAASDVQATGSENNRKGSSLPRRRQEIGREWRA
jgi:hypothetical protein